MFFLIFCIRIIHFLHIWRSTIILPWDLLFQRFLPCLFYFIVATRHVYWTYFNKVYQTILYSSSLGFNCKPSSLCFSNSLLPLGLTAQVQKPSSSSSDAVCKFLYGVDSISSDSCKNRRKAPEVRQYSSQALSLSQVVFPSLQSSLSSLGVFRKIDKQIPDLA